MRGCPRCHVRLNAPVQGLWTIFSDTNSTVVHEAFPPQYKPTDSPDPRFHPLTFKLGLSGSGTKCTVTRGLSQSLV